MATALSVFPIVLLIYLMTKKRSMPSCFALPLMAVLLYLIKMFFFHIDTTLINATVVNGLLTAWTPIMIIWGAVFLFRTMEHTGAMGTIRNWLNEVTTNKVAQLMIIGWAFAFLIEGASGFGTPAAIAAPIHAGRNRSSAPSRAITACSPPVPSGAPVLVVVIAAPPPCRRRPARTAAW